MGTQNSKSNGNHNGKKAVSVDKSQPALTHFERDDFPPLREDMLEVLKDLGDAYGIDFELGSISYTSHDFHVRLSGKIRAGKAKHELKAAQEEWDFGILFHKELKKTDLGKSFKYHGHSYKIVGWESRRGKYPIKCDRDDGKHFKFDTRSVALALGRKVKKEDDELNRQLARFGF